MKNFRLGTAPVHIKLLATSLLIIIGLTYLLLILKIFIGTEMRPVNISETYAEIEYYELTHEAHRYLPYYALFIFAIPTALFMVTSYSEKQKRFFAVAPYITMVIDIFAIYMISYLWLGFAYVVWFFGILLGLFLLALIVLNLYDVWIRKVSMN